MYQRILVPVDDSAASQRGLREAIGLARDQRAGVNTFAARARLRRAEVTRPRAPTAPSQEAPTPYASKFQVKFDGSCAPLMIWR